MSYVKLANSPMSISTKYACDGRDIFVVKCRLLSSFFDFERLIQPTRKTRLFCWPLTATDLDWRHTYFVAAVFLFQSSINESSVRLNSYRVNERQFHEVSIVICSVITITLSKYTVGLLRQHFFYSHL